MKINKLKLRKIIKEEISRLKEGTIPSNAPEKLKQVANAWLKNAMEAAEHEIEELGQVGEEADATRAQWQDRIYLSVDDDPRYLDDKGVRWTLGDGYERTAYTVYYPDTEKWYRMYPYGEEMPMRGGFHEAVAGAEIVWTG